MQQLCRVPRGPLCTHDSASNDVVTPVQQLEDGEFRGAVAPVVSVHADVGDGDALALWRFEDLLPPSSPAAERGKASTHVTCPFTCFHRIVHLLRDADVKTNENDGIRCLNFVARCIHRLAMQSFRLNGYPNSKSIAMPNAALPNTKQERRVSNITSYPPPSEPGTPHPRSRPRPPPSTAHQPEPCHSAPSSSQ